MRLIDKQVKTNPETFAPEMIVTIALPLVQKLDLSGTPPKSFEQWGKDFLNLIGAKEE